MDKQLLTPRFSEKSPRKCLSLRYGGVKVLFGCLSLLARLKTTRNATIQLWNSLRCQLVATILQTSAVCTENMVQEINAERWEVILHLQVHGSLQARWFIKAAPFYLADGNSKCDIDKPGQMLGRTSCHYKPPWRISQAKLYLQYAESSKCWCSSVFQSKYSSSLSKHGCCIFVSYKSVYCPEQYCCALLAFSSLSSSNKT